MRSMKRKMCQGMYTPAGSRGMGRNGAMPEAAMGQRRVHILGGTVILLTPIAELRELLHLDIATDCVSKIIQNFAGDRA